MLTFVLLLTLLLDDFATCGALLVSAQGSLRKVSKYETSPVVPLHIDNRALQAVDGVQYDNEKQGMMQAQHQKNQYNELQQVLASTPGNDGYNKLMVLGHTPFSWKAMIDARGTMEFTDLPKYKSAGMETELESLSQFISHYITTISLLQIGPAAVIAPFMALTEILTPAELERTNNVADQAEKTIAQGYSLKELIQQDFSPVLYAEVVFTKDSWKSEKQLMSFALYTEVYTKKLETLQKEVKTALVASP